MVSARTIRFNISIYSFWPHSIHIIVCSACFGDKNTFSLYRTAEMTYHRRLNSPGDHTVSVYVCMYVCSMYVCTYYVCIYVCMFACM